MKSDKLIYKKKHEKKGNRLKLVNLNLYSSSGKNSQMQITLSNQKEVVKINQSKNWCQDAGYLNEPKKLYIHKITNKIMESLPTEKMMPRFKSKQIEMMNLQAELQAVLLAILSKYCTVSIGRPHRKSTLTIQFMKVTGLEFGNGDYIDTLNFIQRRSAEKAIDEVLKEKTSRKTALRRVQSEKRMELMKFLEDVLMEFGWFVDSHIETADGYDGDVNIFYNGKLFYSTEQIKSIGSQIGGLMFNKLNSNNKVIFDAEEVSQYLMF